MARRPARESSGPTEPTKTNREKIIATQISDKVRELV